MTQVISDGTGGLHSYIVEYAEFVRNRRRVLYSILADLYFGITLTLIIKFRFYNKQGVSLYFVEFVLYQQYRFIYNKMVCFVEDGYSYYLVYHHREHGWTVLLWLYLVIDTMLTVIYRVFPKTVPKFRKWFYTLNWWGNF